MLDRERFEVVRVTCGSVVRSQPPESSSEDNEAKDAAAEVGGKMRTLMLLDRHLGIGIDSCGRDHNLFRERLS